MIIDIFNTDRKYNLILADPPWKQAKGLIAAISAETGKSDSYIATQTIKFAYDNTEIV